jgi:membrane protein DedA with SNARE-associated domain
MLHFATQTLDQLLSTYGYWAVLVFVGLESFGIPLPGETMLVTAALYAGATHRLSIDLVILAACVGAIVGDNCGYALGRFGGWPALLRLRRFLHLRDGRIKLARYVFRRWGGRVVFFGRFVSVLRTYAALLAGITRMPWWRFFAFNASGGVLWATIYGVGAYLLGTQITRLEGPLGVAFGVAAVVVIVAFLLFIRANEARLEREAGVLFPGPLEGT